MSDDEDAEVQIYAVGEYCCSRAPDDDDVPVCFSTLPRLRLGDAAAADVLGRYRAPLYLKGCTDGGVRVLTPVVAWRLELDGEQPEFFVLSQAAYAGGGWLRLARPVRCYEQTAARTLLMTAQLLHFFRRNNPDAPETALWIHLRQAFRKFRPRPSEDDFKNQTSLLLMRQFAATDPVLANSGALRAFVERISTEVGGGADVVDIADDGVIDIADDGVVDIADDGVIDIADDGVVDIADDGVIDITDDGDGEVVNEIFIEEAPF